MMLFGIAANAQDQLGNRGSNIQAQSPEQRMQAVQNGACASDTKRFCSDVTPGQGRIAACLKAHDDKISANCRDQMVALHKDFRAAHQACQSDVQKYCANIPRGGGRILDCLKQHEAQPSAGCKAMAQGGAEELFGRFPAGNTGK